MLYTYYGISAGAVIDSDNRLVEQTDYYPYGMPMTDVNSRSEQPYKYGGKELDRTKGLDLYDFEARQLDFSIPGFTSIDQKAQDYSFLSPYVYCAGNPLRFSDPTGMSIYVNGVFYTTGMVYQGHDPFTQRIIDALNLIAANGGEKLLNQLQASDYEYNYTISTDETTYTVQQEGLLPDTYGGADMHISDDYPTPETTLSVAHESMHSAQFDAGQGGAYHINEVEAYAYQTYIGGNIFNASGGKSFSFFNSNQLLIATDKKSDSSDKIIRQYTYDPQQITNFEEAEMQLTKLFPESIAYQSGKYSNYKKGYPSSRKKSLYEYYISK